MRKLLFGLVVLGFALVLAITVIPRASELLLFFPQPEAAPDEDEYISFEPATSFSVVQGGSAAAFTVENRLKETLVYSLAHEHDFLSFNPHVDKLVSGSRREIFVHVAPDCPPGEISLPVYLRAEANGERLGIETTLTLAVTAGRLSLAWEEESLQALFNNRPAPPGTLVFFRFPGEEEWQQWGETPLTAPPGDLDPGNYKFEFMAALGEVESEVEILRVAIQEVEGLRTASPADPGLPPEELIAAAPAAEEEALEPESPAGAPVAQAPPAPAEPPKPAQPETWVPHADPVRQNYTSYKLYVSGNPQSGTYYFNNLEMKTNNESPVMPDGAHVRINFSRDGLGQYFDWSSSVPVREVLVSGGPTYKFYSHWAPTFGDYYQHAPAMPGSNLYYDIQYIIFYYSGP